MKKLLLSLFTVLIVLVNPGYSQTLKWSASFYNTVGVGQRAVLSDAQGNTYLVGAFSGTVDFDPGPGTATLSNANTSLFVLKLSATGAFMWVKTCGGNPRGTPVMDSQGNICIAGVFQGTIDLDPGTAVAGYTATGLIDGFVLKLDPSGNYLWSRKYGAPNSYVQPSNICVDAQDNVIFSGQFDHTVDFDPGPGTANVTNSSSTWFNAFVAKLDVSGTFIWVKALKGTGSIGQNSTIVDASGNVYGMGGFVGAIDFDPGTASDVKTGSNTSYGDMYVYKWDAAGNVLWTKVLPDPVVGYSMSYDITGYLVVAGTYSATNYDFNPGSGTNNESSVGSEIFVLKLDLAGDFIFVKTFGATMSDGVCVPWSVYVNPNADMFLTGTLRTSGDIDIDPGPGTVTFQTMSFNNDQAFILRLDKFGDYQWSYVFGDSQADAGISVSQDVNANIVASAYFKGSMDVDPGAGTETLTCPSGGGPSGLALFKWCDLADGFPNDARCRGDVGMAELRHEKFEANVYPNPANREFIVEVDLKINSEVSIELVDVLGKTIRTKLPNTFQSAGTKQYAIGVEDLQAGIYFVKVKAGQEQSVTKLMVNR